MKLCLYCGSPLKDKGKRMKKARYCNTLCSAMARYGNIKENEHHYGDFLKKIEWPEVV